MTVCVPISTDDRKAVDSPAALRYTVVTRGMQDMKLEIKLDPARTEPLVTVQAEEITPEVDEIVRRLTQETPRLLTGSRDGRLEILEPERIYRFYASGGKVFAVTERGEYVLRQRLYELEASLDGRQFVRISNAEIIQLKKVEHFDLSITGTILVRLSDGSTSYASRRYVGRIKQMLGV